EAFERLPMPDQRTEGWRRTSLRGLDLRAVEPQLTKVTFTVDGDSCGLVRRLDEVVDDPRVRRQFGQVVGHDVDKFVAFHYALFNVGAVVIVPRGRVIEEPIRVRFTGEGPILAHTLVILEDEADLVGLIEDY